MIYKFVLTEERGLVRRGPMHCYPTRMRAYPIGFLRVAGKETDRCDPNQLKFVCQQLYTETLGLGLRYNDITFQGGPTNSSLKLLLNFVTHECSKMQLSRIRNVILKDNPHRRPIERADFGEVFQLNNSDFLTYAKSYPQTNISVRLSLFSTSLHPELWLIFGSALECAMRGTLLPDLPARFIIHFPRVVEYLRRRLGFFAVPDNVYFFAADLNEEFLINICRQSVQGLNLPPDVWTARFREWYETGF